jgi:hypothetical protein
MPTDWAKSSYSMTDSCVEWRKSSYSTMGDACVETRTDVDGVEVRNSKRPDAGSVQFTNDEWRAFTAGVKAGEFEV